LDEVGGPDSVAIAGGSRERWQISVRRNRLGKHSACSGEQFNGLRSSGRNERSLLLNHAAGILKTQDNGIRGRGGHGTIIRQSK
jgi:hypothetical protein